MAKYEAGDTVHIVGRATVIFKEKEYLVTQVISIGDSNYLMLSSLFQPFQLIFCVVEMDNLEMVTNMDIVNQLLSRVGEKA